MSDVWVVSMAMSSLIGRLLEAKARVFAFQGRVMHAKTAVFDDTLATVGTYNLDARSRRYNRECNIAVYDEETARARPRIVRAGSRRVDRALALGLETAPPRPPLLRLVRLSAASVSLSKRGTSDILG